MTGKAGLRPRRGRGSFQYDPLGKLRKQTYTGRTISTHYDTANRLRRHKDSAGTNAWINWSYDSRCNVTKHGDRVFPYKLDNQPKLSVQPNAASDGSMLYVSHLYYGNKKRIRQIFSDDTDTIYSVYSSRGGINFRETVGGSRYDSIDLGPVTARLTNGGGGVTYAHKDHLGSAVVGTTASGSLYWRERYTPFGEAMDKPYRVSAHQSAIFTLSSQYTARL